MVWAVFGAVLLTASGPVRRYRSRFDFQRNRCPRHWQIVAQASLKSPAGRRHRRLQWFAGPPATRVQILGGMGFMRGTRSERIYREVKMMMIGGGSEEIMKDLAARQLGV